MNASATDPTQRTRMAYLDGWRGVSILLVLIGHFFEIRGVSVQRLGVEFFFVLSGRLMADLLYIKKTPLPIFYKRRISRIFPALWLFAGLMVIVPTTLPIAISWGDFIAAVTFTTNYAQLLLGESDKAMGHLWSLCVEEHAYVILATLAYFHRRNALPLKATLFGLIGLSVTVGALETLLFHHGHHAVYWRTDVRIASILIPTLTYLTLRERVEVEAASSIWIEWRPLFAGVAGVILSVNMLPDFVKYSAGTFCLSYAVCTLDRAAPLLQQALSSRWLTLCGIWSFSLYLWQQPFFALHLAGYAPRWLLIPALFLPSLLSFYLVEQPLRRWLNRVWCERPQKIPLSPAVAVEEPSP